MTSCLCVAIISRYVSSGKGVASRVETLWDRARLGHQRSKARPAGRPHTDASLSWFLGWIRVHLKRLAPGKRIHGLIGRPLGKHRAGMLRWREPGPAAGGDCVFPICLCPQSSSRPSIRLLEVGKVLNHLYSRLSGRLSLSRPQEWAAGTEGCSAGGAWPVRGTRWLERGGASSSMALAAPWRTGRREDAALAARRGLRAWGCGEGRGVGEVLSGKSRPFCHRKGSGLAAGAGFPFAFSVLPLRLFFKVRSLEVLLRSTRESQMEMFLNAFWQRGREKGQGKVNIAGKPGCSQAERMPGWFKMDTVALSEFQCFWGAPSRC